MNTELFSKLTMSSIIAATLLFTGCGEKTDEAQALKEAKNIKVEKTIETPSEKVVEPKKEAMAVYTKYDSIINDVFRDVAKIAPDGKQMILVFGTNTDPYSDRLKADIKNTPELAKKLKEQFTSYYFKAHENLRHKQLHEGEMMDVDTKTMINIYNITATPTIIFTDDNGKAVIVVPGYMPPKQFLTTMNFMNEGKWKGKDRKNGEVYEALRNYYVENGIDVKKKAE